ncbi:MAG: TatD family hydrolase, partial [Desulfobacterales bacterium]
AASGLAAVVSVGETLAEAEKNLALARRFPLLRPAAGLYPTQLDFAQAEALCGFIREHRAALHAVGEVGLDHWKVQDEAGRAKQKEIFELFIRLAIELDLPLNVHSRAAGREAIACLLACGARRVQLHAFDGRAQSALAAVEAGYFFSIPPSAARSPQKQKLVRRLPLDCLLVETDSPVLGPEPGRRNEPANLRFALAAIARAKGLPEEETALAIAENTARLYGPL